MIFLRVTWHQEKGFVSTSNITVTMIVTTIVMIIVTTIMTIVQVDIEMQAVSQRWVNAGEYMASICGGKTRQDNVS